MAPVRTVVAYRRYGPAGSASSNESPRLCVSRTSMRIMDESEEDVFFFFFINLIGNVRAFCTSISIPSGPYTYAQRGSKRRQAQGFLLEATNSGTSKSLEKPYVSPAAAAGVPGKAYHDRYAPRCGCTTNAWARGLQHGALPTKKRLLRAIFTQNLVVTRSLNSLEYRPLCAW